MGGSTKEKNLEFNYVCDDLSSDPIKRPFVVPSSKPEPFILVKSMDHNGLYWWVKEGQYNSYC
jgi:hypothetical protein